MKILNKMTFVILALICSLFNGNVHSQTLEGKELMTNEASHYNDDSFYQWFKYMYSTDDGLKYAAFDQNGRRITPIAKSVSYIGGGIFKVFSGKFTSEGKLIHSLYNTKGSIIMSEDIWVMSGFETAAHLGYGMLELSSRTANGEKQGALYTIQGQCFASVNMGYNYFEAIKRGEIYWILAANFDKKIWTIYDFSGKKVFSGEFCNYYGDDYGLWSCEKDGNHYLYSRDFKYVAQTKNLKEFNSNKKINPDYNGPYNFSPISPIIYSPTPDPQTPNPPMPDPPKPNPPKPAPAPVQVWKACGMCSGGGVCYMCNGAGGYYFGVNAKWMECTACHGLKRCTFCAGQGGHYEVEYR